MSRAYLRSVVKAEKRRQREIASKIRVLDEKPGDPRVGSYSEDNKRDGLQREKYAHGPASEVPPEDLDEVNILEDGGA